MSIFFCNFAADFVFYINNRHQIMQNIHSIAVYCASSNKIRQSFVDAAETLGEDIAQRGMRLIYGDGGIGLMAAVTNAMGSPTGETKR